MTAAAVRGFLCAGLVLGCPQAALAYKLQQGDAIEISVAGLPELRQRVAVQADGSISFPLLGALPVVGLSPSELRVTIQGRLANKIYRQRTNDGREIAVVIQPEEVSAAIVEYRPVYVSGYVAKPGELTFRLDMTVRQAVALAGGYDLAPARMLSPFLEASSLKGEYGLASTEFAKEWARAARIKSELKEQETIEGVDAPDSRLSKEKMAEIVSFEIDALRTHLADFRHEKAFLQAAAAQADEQIAVIAKQQKAEDQGAQADTQELQKLLDFYSRGDVASPRVIDARRALLLSSTRALQVTAQLLQLRKQQKENQRQLERFEDQRKAGLLRDLQDASLLINSLRIKKETADEKLRYISSSMAQMTIGVNKRPDIRVVRRGDDGRTQLSVDEDFELMPGDVVEIAVRSAQAVDAVSR